MRIPYYGDSYDIVKRFLLHTLDPEGDWAALPMFSEDHTRLPLRRALPHLGLTPTALPAPSDDEATSGPVIGADRGTAPVPRCNKTAP
jgi:hypothetical protein